MNLPPQLHPGDTIGILSTSSPVKSSAVETMKKYFEKRGYRVRIAPHALADAGFLAGTAEDRAADLNAMLRDPVVRMLMTANGGSGADHLLPLVDYDALSTDPKLVVGLSNPAVLLNALTARTGVPTIHGPNGVEFGCGPLTSFTEENFWPLVQGGLKPPYEFPVGKDIRVVRGGPAVEGALFGGHLKTVQRLIGTPYAPDWQGCILFVEEYDLVLSDADKCLTHFRNAGALESIAGLIFGRAVNEENDPVETLEEMLLRVCDGLNFPIFSGIPIGHTDDKITVSLGCRVRMDPGRPSLTLLDPPVGLS